jgi:putative SOS response-associated peptidase YedK
MWAPCLYDYWENKDGFGFYSFAIVTDDPPEEVSIMGHDRCPIFLSEQKIGDWLNSTKFSRAQLYEILKFKEAATFEYAWAA